MLSIEEINAFYNQFSQNPGALLPDGVAEVDHGLLSSLEVHREEQLGSYPAQELLQAIESGGRITLFNERYVLWIIPQGIEYPPSTTVILAKCYQHTIKPEVGFRTSGVHNDSKTILQLIDRYLLDMQETEEVIAKFERSIDPDTKSKELQSPL